MATHNVIGDMIKRQASAMLAELRRDPVDNPPRSRNTGAKGCEAAILDPGRSCPRHTYCYKAQECRRMGAAYRQGAVAWEADIALAANPYGAAGDGLAYAWGRGWRDRADHPGPTA